jgi:pterin-4a-carbinolamine dehydratase
MRIQILLLCAGVFCAGHAKTQIKKQFYVEDQKSFQRTEFSLYVYAGNCSIKPNHHPDILNIYSNQDVDSYSHSFNKDIRNKTCYLNLQLEDNKSEGLSQTISSKVFGKPKDYKERLWQVYLSDNKPYSLDLKYGLGSAQIDLSGLSIQKLKIHTGSADVNVGYFSALENQVLMDTFYVNVAYGAVKVDQLTHARSKNFIAHVGFGNLTLDYSDKNETKSMIKASIGAGNLLVLLHESPAIIHLNSSMLCGVSIPKSFTKVNETTYVNKTYSPDSPNLLTFHIDVSMGNIVFKDKGATP